MSAPPVTLDRSPTRPVGGVLRHGHAREGRMTPEYRAWRNMKSRCLNPKVPKFEDYGGRGITVCDAWVESFETFLADMGPRPEGTSLERKDNDQGYGPGNCVWATMTQQLRNRRNSRMLTYAGRTQCVSAWAEELGFADHVVRNRLAKGWSIERALMTPVGGAA